MLSRQLILACITLATIAFANLAQALELVMVEERGCMYCAQWNAEVAPEYGKTSEGRAAPLRRIDLNAPLPQDLHLKGRIIYTPTFILVDEGAEIVRLEGYPGEHFFWPLLGKMLDMARAKEGS